MGITFNPLSGTFDITGSSVDNFSYNVVASGVTVNIPLYQQMIVIDLIDVIGTLEIDGELALVA